MRNHFRSRLGVVGIFFSLLFLWNSASSPLEAGPVLQDTPDPEASETQIRKFIQELREKNENVRVDASTNLATIGKPAVPFLIEALKEKEIRAVVTFILGRIGPNAKAAVPALIEEIKDEDKNVRARAVEALGKIGPETMPTLLAALKDKEPIVRVRAVQALGRLGPAAVKATSAIVDVMQDPDESVRSEAALALKKINQE